MHDMHNRTYDLSKPTSSTGLNDSNARGRLGLTIANIAMAFLAAAALGYFAA